jgi:hypothetical protein
MGRDLSNYVGMRFGSRVVISPGRDSSKPKVSTLCDCGVYGEVSIYNLENGRCTMCRRCARLAQTNYKTLHGDSSPESKYYKLYCCWKNMKGRCYRKSASHYERYGGRGISVCDNWLNDYSNFKEWAISSGWEEGLTIDRHDVDKNYEPFNCQWITNEENVKKMTEYHLKYKTGCYSESANKLQRARVIKNSGQRVKIHLQCGDQVFDSMGLLADFLSEELNRDRASVYSQIKQCCNPKNKCKNIGGYKVEKV